MHCYNQQPWKNPNLPTLTKMFIPHLRQEWTKYLINNAWKNSEKQIFSFYWPHPKIIKLTNLNLFKREISIWFFSVFFFCKTVKDLSKDIHINNLNLFHFKKVKKFFSSTFLQDVQIVKCSLIKKIQDAADRWRVCLVNFF